MISALMRAAATVSAARSLRAATDKAVNRVLLALGAGAALAVSAVCLTFAAFVVLERQLDAASASAIVGGVWGIVGVAGFIKMRR
ncbi:hypothetical protein [Reyranella sp.]|uniref:hypothetical protein n=1 Tax=Reyranella sp. TaxID=1929291 RepID=UPI001216748C|nr:hypothetical protein [Reyranella sp.]TAJ83890.1 MAG: hypothetical protein EPO50_20115 [Reyranella sp.]